MKIEFTPIGIVRSPFETLDNMPIQPSGAKGIEGTADIFEEFRAGLADLDGFSHVILLYHFHRSSSFSLSVVPFMDSAARGLFATRAPRRPNQIGLSVVELIEIRAGILHIRNIDIVDGTPLLDIKPYVPEFDAPEKARIGWLETRVRAAASLRSDDRFE
jgi:tRNA-Thr(GGU) m(6)t(6)A37 methyltransferase TsaA